MPVDAVGQRGHVFCTSYQSLVGPDFRYSHNALDPGAFIGADVSLMKRYTDRLSMKKWRHLQFRKERASPTKQEGYRPWEPITELAGHMMPSINS